MGYNAGLNISTGSSNIDIGNQGLLTDTNLIRIGASQTATFIAGVINGNGGGLANLNASQLTSIGNTNGGGNNFFVGPSGNSTTSGSGNTANGIAALQANTIGGGNTAFGILALGVNTIGSDNTAIGEGALQDDLTGSNNIALGFNAGVVFSGNESSNIDIGNVGVLGENNIIRIGALQTDTYLAGNVHAAGNVFANGVQLTSDRNAKENFMPVAAEQVLAKVASLPVAEWNYKTDPAGQKHLGPMAQDFQAAFGLNGGDDKHISVVDEGGVALAAIQGLNQKLNEKDSEIQNLKQQNESLEKRLDDLEQAVKSLVNKN